MGEVLSRVKEEKLAVHHRQRVMPDGTTIRCTWDGTTPIITIIPGPASDEPAGVKQEAAVWIPRGFLIYPAAAEHKAGWGLPVIPAAAPNDGPFAAENLDPGLDVERWTAGGPLGQVLLSQDDDAGYNPRDPDDYLVAPLFYQADSGIFLTDDYIAPAQRGWGAYRIAFVDFTAQTPEATDEERVRFAAIKRDVFQRVNARRLAIGRKALYLPVKGFYDSAQASAECMAAAGVLGHFSEEFPRTYQTPSDRVVGKDGQRDVARYIYADTRDFDGVIGENSMANVVPPFETIGTDPNGYPIYRVVAGEDVTANDAFDGWMESDAHRANLESSAWDKASTTFFGIKNAFAVQHFIRLDDWIPSGNCFWHSVHDDIPPLSWFGFAQRNLAFETWPVAWNRDPSSPIGDCYPGDPFTVFPFTDEEGRCWLKYRYASGLDVPAMDNRIFARGRSIGLAPRGGLVWAAAAVRRTRDGATVDRLVVLVHHPEDQPADTKHNGATRYLRAWWCDIPERDGLALNPQSIIRGVFGDEENTRPWHKRNYEWSWRGGQLIDVGGTNPEAPDLLKYGSAWRFDRSGTKAICLRDHRAYADWSELYSTNGIVHLSGQEHRAVELVFDPQEDSHSATVTFHGDHPGSVGDPVVWTDAHVREGSLPDIFWTGGSAALNSATWTAYALIAAADYDADGNPVFAVDGRLVFNAANPIVYFFGRVGLTDTFATMQDRVWYATNLPTHGLAPLDRSGAIHVLDVVGSVGVVGLVQSIREGRSALLNPDYVCWYDTEAPVIKVNAYRAGALIDSRSYGNPDGAVMYPQWQPCSFRIVGGGSQYVFGLIVELSRSRFLLGSYAQDRNGEYVLTYCLVPQPHVTYWFDAPGSGSCGDATSALSCTPSWFDSPYHAMSDTDPLNSRGGWMTSSIGDLADLTQTPGTAPHSLYARIV